MPLFYDEMNVTFPTNQTQKILDFVIPGAFFFLVSLAITFELFSKDDH